MLGLGDRRGPAFMGLFARHNIASTLPIHPRTAPSDALRDWDRQQGSAQGGCREAKGSRMGARIGAKALATMREACFCSQRCSSRSSRTPGRPLSFLSPWPRRVPPSSSWPTAVFGRGEAFGVPRAVDPRRARASREFGCLRMFAGSVLVLRRRARYTTTYADFLGAEICGCRQVVRPQLPKLVSAGSSPVTRSIEIGCPVPFWHRAFSLPTETAVVLLWRRSRGPFPHCGRPGVVAPC